MRKMLPIVFISSLTFIATAVYAAVDTAKLIKVTAPNNPGCVEYYRYQGELYCSTTPQSKTKVDPTIKDKEKQTIVFDERPWLAAWSQQTPIVTTIEYVPMGDNVESWNELVTSQFMPYTGNQVSFKQYVENVIQSMKDAGFKPDVKIIEDKPNQIIFEFRIASPINQKQDELQKVTQGKDGYYLLHYVIKKSDMGEKNREKWLKNLKASGVKG